jgi:hypothetical protein
MKIALAILCLLGPASIAHADPAQLSGDPGLEIATPPPEDDAPETGAMPAAVTASPEPVTTRGPTARSACEASCALLLEPRWVDDKPTPIYKKWWLWTTLGAVTATLAMGIGLGVGLGIDRSPPGPAFTISPRTAAIHF